MKYYIRKPYRIIGFSDAPFCLMNCDTGERTELSISDFVLLKECYTGFEPDDKDADYHKDKERLQSWTAEGVTGNEPEQDPPAEYEYCEFVSRNSIQIAITARCNYNCRHCLAAEGYEVGIDELSLEFCDRILKEAAECHVKNVLLTGGEPLLHPDFIEIVKKTGEHGLRLSRILTNGSPITEELLDKIIETGQKPDFAISFDGIGTHDWMRNTEGAEKAALSAFRLVRKKGFATIANINVNSTTILKLTETCRMLVREYGVSMLHLMITSPVPRWEDTAGRNASLPLDDYYESMIELVKISREENWKVYLDIFLMPGLHNLENPSFECFDNPPAATGQEKLMNSCPKAKSIIFVGHDGRVLPCSAYEGTTNARGLMQGEDLNLYYHSLKEILTDSSYLNPFKATISDLKDTSPLCTKCRWTHICRGGCRIFSVYYSNSDEYNCGACGADCVFYRGGYVEKYIEMLKTYVSYPGMK